MMALSTFILTIYMPIAQFDTFIFCILLVIVLNRAFVCIWLLYWCYDVFIWLIQESNTDKFHLYSDAYE